MASGKFSPPMAPHEIGEPFAVALHLGALPPSQIGPYRYIELTAGKSGVGEYNNGLITSEIVTGAFPLVIATAEIALVGSPLVGQSIHLLNTEQRFIQPGIAGTVNRHHTAPPVSAFSAASNGSHSHGMKMYTSGSIGSFAAWADSNRQSGEVSTNAAGAHTHTVSGGDAVTRPKYGEFVFFMRIK